jgi:ubiquinone/menaquinone biosynthesis C-methylase UbiE
MESSYMLDETKARGVAPDTKGRVIHWAAGYDLLVRLFFLGRERSFRDRLIRAARLEPGEPVLDIGCGTGSLAIAAKHRVDAAGMVCGIDASPEMIERARRKARKAQVDVRFADSVVERMPFPDGHFDVVLSTMMLHHLPGAARRQCLRETARVLKPGGRVLVVDFGGRAEDNVGLFERFHRHGGVTLAEIIALLGDAGFRIEESGALDMRGLNFVLARR